MAGAAFRFVSDYGVYELGPATHTGQADKPATNYLHEQS
jgi:hypothetical protein